MGESPRASLAAKAHAFTEREIFTSLASSANGLSSSAAQAALEKYGPNRLSAQKKNTALDILMRQVSNMLILILLAAAGVSYAIGHPMDAAGILVAVLLSVFFGFFQEYRAEQALAALQKMTAPKAIVLRDGREHEIAAEEVVPGDVLLLTEGMLVPADARMLDGGNISIDQSLLTGESQPVHKHSKLLPPRTSLSERANMLYAGTQVVRGHARALAIATGASSEFGRIASKLSETETPQTPLQKKLGELGEQVGKSAIALSAVFFIIGLLRGQPWGEMLVVSVSLAVAAIPEGLPTVLAITMAIGVARMARHQALVRRLPAVETLGSATVICTDKTGTLTANVMTVERIHSSGIDYEVAGGPLDLQGAVSRVDGKIISAPEHESLARVLTAFTLCNDASLPHEAGDAQASGSEQASGSRGDPTEVALLVAAHKYGLDLQGLRASHALVADLPFEYARKMMTQVRKKDGKIIAYVKGAPEVVLARCTHYYENGRVVKMTPAQKKRLHAVFESYSSRALRTLAVAVRELKPSPSYAPTPIERQLTWLGVCAMLDPPRPEVKGTLRLCREAGIRVIMLTGDSKTTAHVIARDLGLLDSGGLVMEGEELEKLPKSKYMAALSRLAVLARATPDHKFAIVTALQKCGEVVAVTGDGVNDAPSIQKADIGVAMGMGGTDVARGAADLVLTDNNFDTLVRAVERGRSIYENIRSFVRFQFTTNVAALFLMFSSPLLGLPLPLLPLQILWINLIMDGPPALALGVEPERSEVMRERPRNPASPFLSKPFLTAIVRSGLLMFLMTLAIFVWYLSSTPAKAGTMVFTVFILLQLVNALNCRSWRRPFYKHLFANPALLAALSIALVLHLSILYWPPLQTVFNATPLGAGDWLILMGACALMAGQEEVFKKMRAAE